MFGYHGPSQTPWWWWYLPSWVANLGCVYGDETEHGRVGAIHSALHLIRH